MELELIKFLKSHPNNWKEILEDKPYGLIIKEEGNLVLFKYTMWDSDFSEPIANECRGLILEKDTWKPVCVPFFKFFNYNEPFNKTSEIDWESARVQTKIDGSILKLYFYNNKWNIATNSMIDAFSVNAVSPKIEEATEARSFGDLFIEAAKNQSLDYDRLNKNNTYVFELTSKYNEQVVHYDGIKIWHLGTRNNTTLDELTEDIGIQKPREWNISNLTDCVKIAEQFREEQEGFVVVDKNWNRIKIKSPFYFLKSHELNDNVSLKKLVDIFLSGDYEEFLAYFPKYKGIIGRLKAKMNEDSKNLEAEWKDVEIFSADKTRGEFFKLVEDNPHCHFFMKKYTNPDYDATNYLLSWIGLRKYLIKFFREI